MIDCRATHCQVCCMRLQAYKTPGSTPVWQGRALQQQEQQQQEQPLTADSISQCDKSSEVEEWSPAAGCSDCLAAVMRAALRALCCGLCCLAGSEKQLQPSPMRWV